MRDGWQLALNRVIIHLIGSGGEMKSDKFTKAIELRERGAVSANGGSSYFVLSYSRPNRYAYIVTVQGACNCEARALCCHALASVFYDAALCVQLMRWAADEEFLEAVREKYQPAIKTLPERVRVAVRTEYIEASRRLREVVPVVLIAGQGWEQDGYAQKIDRR